MDTARARATYVVLYEGEGIELWRGTADSPEHALDRYAQEQGYRHFADMAPRILWRPTVAREDDLPS